MIPNCLNGEECEKFEGTTLVYDFEKALDKNIKNINKFKKRPTEY